MISTQKNIERKTLEVRDLITGVGESIYINLKAITELHHETLLNQFDVKFDILNYLMRI
jgi:hypothetical protein